MEFEPMKIAIEEAKLGVDLFHGGPFGAVIIRNNAIIGRGHNKVVINNDPTAHAEIEAIRNACNSIGNFDLSGSILYTTCYPCPMCLGAILWAKIDKIIYCLASNDVSELGFNDEMFYEIIYSKSSLINKIINDNNEKMSCLELLKHYSHIHHTLY